MKKIIRTLLSIILIGVIAMMPSVCTYAQENNEDNSVHGELLYSSEDFSIYLESDEPISLMSTEYVTHRTYYMKDNSGRILVRWNVSIYYEYSDGDYVQINSVDVDDYNVSAGLAVAFPASNDYIRICNHGSWASGNVDYNVAITLSGKQYYITLYSEVDYWGNFTYSIYDR